MYSRSHGYPKNFFAYSRLAVSAHPLSGCRAVSYRCIRFSAIKQLIIVATSRSRYMTKQHPLSSLQPDYGILQYDISRGDRERLFLSLISLSLSLIKPHPFANNLLNAIAFLRVNGVLFHSSSTTSLLLSHDATVFAIF